MLGEHLAPSRVGNRQLYTSVSHAVCPTRPPDIPRLRQRPSHPSSKHLLLSRPDSSFLFQRDSVPGPYHPPSCLGLLAYLGKTKWEQVAEVLVSCTLSTRHGSQLLTEPHPTTLQPTAASGRITQVHSHHVCVQEVHKTHSQVLCFGFGLAGRMGKAGMGVEQRKQEVHRKGKFRLSGPRIPTQAAGGRASVPAHPLTLAMPIPEQSTTASPLGVKKSSQPLVPQGVNPLLLHLLAVFTSGFKPCRYPAESQLPFQH